MWCALWVAFVIAATSGIFSFGVQDNNEGLYATIAKEMLASGEWVVPHLNGVVYLEKPPLLYWMVAASLALFGHNEVAVRLVPVFFMGLTVLGLLRLLAQMGRLRAGWMAAAMLVSTGGFVVMSRSLLFDVPMTACLMWALVFFHAYRQRNHRRMLWLFYVCLALGVLAKGPTALVLGGGCVVVATLLLDRSLRSVLRVFDPIGILIFFAITVPWHLWAEVRHPGFAHFYFVNEHILRFLNLREPHDYYRGPVYYYLLRLPLYLGLWTLFLPLLWLGRSKGKRTARAEVKPPATASVAAPLPLAGQRSAGMSHSAAKQLPLAASLGVTRPLPVAESQFLIEGRVLLWVAFLLPLVFFSISGAKANYYCLPAIPPLLALLALHWPNATPAWHGQRWLRQVSAALLLLALAALVGLAVVPQWVSIPEPWGGFVTCWRVWLVMSLLALAAVGAVWAMRRLDAQALFFCICAGGLIPWLAAPLALSLAEPELSNRQVAQYLNAEPEGDGIVVFYRDYEYMSSLGFYLENPVSIVNCMSNDLYYARGLQRYPTTFIDMDTLGGKAIGGRIYLVMRNDSSTEESLLLAAEGFRELRNFQRLRVLVRTPQIQETSAHLEMSSAHFQR